jgi:signal transduction histidine kinase
MEDAQGTIWVANPDGLWSLRDGLWREHSRADGLLTDSPYVMALAADGSIWLRHRYDAGVDRMEVSGDRIVRVTAIVRGDPKSVEVTAFHGFDAFGNFWRGGAIGVGVRHGDTWTTYTTEDGLVWNDCDGEAFWADADGGVWIGTSGGLSHYHPENGDLKAPQVADPTITRLELVKPDRLIRAEFSTMNYKAERLAHFAYRLDDEPWSDSVERNISIAGLGPGKHRLEVRCRVRDGPFSPRIATAEFQVKPTWRETWWARMLALAFGMAAISQFVRWRLRASARRQVELEASTEQLRRLSANIQSARETEAARIARQIHDELGGILTSFRWEVAALEKLIHQTGDAGQVKVMQDKLIAMLGLTDTTINVVRRISSELRPNILDNLGLMEAIEWQTQQFQGRTGIQCRFDCAVQSIPLGEQQSTAVFRIVQEALTNILRHAQATRVCVALEEEDGVFILTVTDNGRGITQSETLNRDSLGLLGMQERAHLIGGRLDIVGLPGKGTTLRVRVPLSGTAT